MLENATSWTERFSCWSSLSDEFGFGENSSLSNCTNVTQYSGEDDSKQKPELNVPYTVLESLVAFFAVIGNALVIIVFYRERRLRRRTNYYIISLATADFLVGLLGIPFAILVNIMNKIKIKSNEIKLLKFCNFINLSRYMHSNFSSFV